MEKQICKIMGLYEEIMLLNDLAHKENNGLTAEENEALKDIVDYADGEYVNHCEEIGRIAIEDIERMEKEWFDKACEWLKNDLGDVMEENVFQKMLYRFRKAMEE